jgi:alcohol dehydrogenase YqhD (iron-dependent ADH family)
MSGGVNQFFVHTVGEVPVRVRLGSGAGQVVLDGTSHLGVAAGALFTPDRWDETVDRIDVNAVAGMAALTIGP